MSGKYPTVQHWCQKNSRNWCQEKIAHTDVRVNIGNIDVKKIAEIGFRMNGNIGVSIIENTCARKKGNTDVRKILETVIRIIGNTGNN